MQTSELRDDLRAKLIAFSWEQWTQIGVSGWSDRRNLWAADPEALLVFSLVVSRHEPRLFDEILDWVTLNLRLVSIQRLRNLARHHDDVVRRLVDAVVAWSNAHAKEVTRRAPMAPSAPPEPRTLFRIDGREARVSEADPIFADYGFQRPATGPSGKSRVPDLSASINLGFRLREIFGIGSRAEVIRVLLTSREDRLLNEIAEAAGYAPRNVREALDSLVEAGVTIISLRAKSRSYRLDRTRWGEFLGIAEQDMPIYVPWVQVLRALTRMHLWLEEEAALHRTEYMQASEARRLMDEVKPDLLAADVSVQNGRGLRGAEYWPAFVQDVQAVLTRLEEEPVSWQR
jgi:hypothetical protein